MGLTIKENTKIAVMREVTEGTFVPAASGADFIGVLGDGLELTPSKELLERGVLTGSIGKSAPRTGTRSVSGNIGTELKAGQSTGAVPEAGLMVEAALGGARTRTVSTLTAATTTTLTFANVGAEAKYAVGDIVHVKKAGAHHVSPITSVVFDSGADTEVLTMLVAMPVAAAPGDTIAAVATYFTANSGHPSISVSKYVEDAVFEKGIGCRVSSMSLANYTTGQLPSLAFGLEGLNFDRDLEAPAYVPSLDTSLPPVVLNACVFIDGVDIQMNEVAWSVENTLAFATSTCSSNGRISSRVASRDITGTLNPYKQDDDLAQYNRFQAGTPFSLFSFAYNPTSTAGEFEQVVAFYLPKCIVTELGEGDADGILQDAISFTASRGSDGATEEMYVSFI